MAVQTEEQALKPLLTLLGYRIVGVAKILCNVKTGRLRASLTFEIRGNKLVLGSPVSYAPYVHNGWPLPGKESYEGNPFFIKAIARVLNQANN